MRREESLRVRVVRHFERFKGPLTVAQLRIVLKTSRKQCQVVVRRLVQEGLLEKRGSEDLGSNCRNGYVWTGTNQKGEEPC